MTFRKLFKKLSNILFIPVIIASVCLLIFQEQLNTFKYAQIVRVFVVIMGITLIIGTFIKDKK